ncbi:MAG: hypothetical protein JNJ54_12405 [Myxococcaceae bacterium]|nr:hypothetical protein [Myxococcaceae bacterium]
MMLRIVTLVGLLGLAGCGATIGDACTTAKDCGSGLCLNRDFTPGGYCALGCVLGGAACPAGSVCVDDAVGRDSPGCLRSCRSSLDCREGYICRTERSSPTPVCVGPEGI